MLVSAALVILLAEHPALLSLEELTRMLSSDPHDWREQDAVRVALGQLRSDGLTHQHGAFYFATKAAIRGQALQP
ncbi:MAG: hypothetical protein Q8O56_12095 [Solirubrobacteraceae bacterium]|nr:hypothetical protein [Solirubrobacteraceae bacterium]